MAYIRNAIIMFTVSACLSVTCSCSRDAMSQEMDEALKAADNFAGCYFNYELEATKDYCTPESVVWLSFLASNINQEDIDIINEQDKPATVETKDVEMTSDTTAVAICEVRNFLKLDTLGRPGEIASKALYPIPLVKRDGRWLVRMEGLLQSEKQNHD